MMRGGPRMMCSPYLTGSLAVMLVLVTFNYWSVSTTNFDLIKEVKQMQVQLKTGSDNIQEKDNDRLKLKEMLDKSQKEVLDLKKKAAQCNENLTLMDEKRQKEVESANKKVNLMKENILQNTQESEKNAVKATEEKEVLEKEVDNLKEELDRKTKELVEAKAEIVSLKASEVLVPGHVKQGSLVFPDLPSGGAAPLGNGQLGDVDPQAVSVIRKETNGGAGVHLVPLQPPSGPSSPKPFGGISSSKKPSLIVNVAGVMPPPNNLDQAEDDSHIPEHENGPEGKKDLQDDDQNPDGQIDENVDLEKQHFLEEKTEKGDTKDVVVEGQEDANRLNILQDSFNAGGGGSE